MSEGRAVGRERDSRLRRVARGVAGFVIGYALFAATAAALFSGMHIDPHAGASARVIAITTVVGMAGAGAGAWIGSWIGRSRWPGIVIALLIAVAAVATLVLRPGEGAVWSQVAALLLIAPAALIAALAAARLHRV